MTDFENLTPEEQEALAKKEMGLDSDDDDWDSEDDNHPGSDDKDTDEGSQWSEDEGQDKSDEWSDEWTDDWDEKSSKKEKILKKQAWAWKSKYQQAIKRAEDSEKRYNDLKTKLVNWEIEDNDENQEALLDARMDMKLAKQWISNAKDSDMAEFKKSNPDVDLTAIDTILKENPTLSYEEANHILQMREGKKPLDPALAKRRQLWKQSLAWGSTPKPKSKDTMTTAEMEKELNNQFRSGKLEL